MKERCLDIGIVQAFMDGELPHDQIAGVSDHLEGCDSCALMLAEGEEESAVVFSALDREFNSLVPTQRLWNKINESIEIQQANRPFWEKAQAFLARSFANPSMIAAAGLLIVLGVYSLLVINKQPESINIASAPTARSETIDAPAAASEPVKISEPINVSSEGDKIVDARPRIEQAVYRPKLAARNTVPAVDNRAMSRSNGNFGAEASYVKTISSLSRTVEAQKDEVLRPSERVAYERDLALVNDTIARMRQVVKQNPRNESAKQVLYASYQNKIDLLNSVSQKEELVASLK